MKRLLILMAFVLTSCGGELVIIQTPSPVYSRYNARRIHPDLYYSPRWYNSPYVYGYSSDLFMGTRYGRPLLLSPGNNCDDLCPERVLTPATTQDALR